MKIFLIVLIFSSCMFLQSCRRPYYNKIEISTDKIQSIKNAMVVVQNTLESSNFDTLAIKQTWIQNDIDEALLFNENLNKDSLSLATASNFKLAELFPLRKKILYSKSKTFILNERLIGKTNDEFTSNILTCKEFKNLQPKEKDLFAKSFLLLIENHIWSCYQNFNQDSNNSYSFDYSKDNLYYGESSARYLFLDKTALTNSNLINNYILLDQKDGLMLYSKRL